MKRNPEDVVNKDPLNPVQFGPPVVSSDVRDPAAIRYAALATQRHPANADRYLVPVGGGQGPPIPPLTAQAESGLSMADQARLLRGTPPPTALGGNGGAPSGGIFQGFPTAPSQEEAPSAFPGRQPAQQGPVILQTDLLPEEARKDPEFREGQGSMYAASQPHLAMRYGVIRNKQRLMPAQLGATPKGLRPESLNDLKALQELQEKRQKAEAPAVDREIASETGQAAARYGQIPKKTEEEKKTVEDIISRTDDFDLAALRDAQMHDTLNNEEQRKIIEARLTPIDFEDLIMTGRVSQKVPIVPKIFEPTFESTSAGEDLAVKRLVMVESRGVEVSDRYLLDKFSVMSVVLAVTRINNNPLPSHRDEDGKFNEDKFWEKYQWLAKYPTHMIASLGVHAFWFEMRVRKLFKADALGNG